MLPDELFLGIHMYGVMIAVGLLFCFGVLWYYSKKWGASESFIDFLFYNGLGSVVVGFGAAALFQAVYDYIENPEKGFHINGGITFIGGLIGGAVFFILMYIIFRRRLQGRLMDVLTVIPCAILIAHAFGRIGCFCAGCCYGKETDGIFGMQFPHLSHPVYPTQLYEAIFLFVMFGVCTYLLFKKHSVHNMSLYLFSYGIFRFAIEYLRGDYRGEFIIPFLTPSQFWSLLMFLGSFAVYFLEKKYATPYPISQKE